NNTPMKGRVKRALSRSTVLRSAVPVGQRGVELGRRADRTRLQPLVDALDQAGQHLARAAFCNARGTANGQRLHALRPAHRQVKLALQRATDLVQRGVALRLGVLDYRDGR